MTVDTSLTGFSSLKGEVNKQITIAPVITDVQNDAAKVVEILVSQNKDIATAAVGTTTISAGGFIFIGSPQDKILLLNVTTTGANGHSDVRLKTRADIVNANSNPNAIDVQGGSIVLEAGFGAIGTANAPININLLSGGSLSARAQNDIFITAPIGGIAVDGIYSSSGNLRLWAEGNITDAVASPYAKIQAQNLDIRSFAGSIGSTSHDLDVHIIGTVVASAAVDIHYDEAGGVASIWSTMPMRPTAVCQPYRRRGAADCRRAQ